MAPSTRATYVQPTYTPQQQIAQMGRGAVQAVTFNPTVGGVAGTTTYFDGSLGSAFSVTLTASGSTLSAINPLAGQTISLFLKQDGTGSRTVTWDSWLWASGSAPTLSTTASATDVIQGQWNDALTKW